MPVQRAAFKALRQNAKARARNLATKNSLKKLNVKLRKAYTAKQLDQAKSITQEYIKALDKAAQRNIIHRNVAARKKSRLQQQLRKATA